MRQFNYPKYLSKTAVAYQEQIDSIDTADTISDCSKHAERATGIVLAVYCLAETLGGEWAEELEAVGDSWRDDIETHYNNRADALHDDTDIEKAYINE